MNEKAQSITSTIVGVLALLNFLAERLGWIPLSISQDTIYQFVSALVLILSAIWNWYKNHNVTEAARLGQDVTESVKRGLIDQKEIEDIIYE